jgi:hypothetical protein
VKYTCWGNVIINWINAFTSECNLAWPIVPTNSEKIRAIDHNELDSSVYALHSGSCSVPVNTDCLYWILSFVVYLSPLGWVPL